MLVLAQEEAFEALFRINCRANFWRYLLSLAYLPPRYPPSVMLGLVTGSIKLTSNCGEVTRRKGVRRGVLYALACVPTYLHVYLSRYLLVGRATRRNRK